MTTACSTTPTTPRLPIPPTPDFPKFTTAELQALQSCTLGKATCTVPRSVILKYADKLTMYKGYARECKAILMKNNQRAK